MNRPPSFQRPPAPTGLLVFGFGGHARSVADIALACGTTELVFVDENVRAGEQFFHYRVLREWDQSLPDGWHAFSAAGDAAIRARHHETFTMNGWPHSALIADSATVGIGASIGCGCMIGNHAHIGPMATVGVGCIINTAAVVEHECVIREFTHVSVNATVAGRTTVGRRCMIGAGASVIDGLQIGDDIVIGAGAVVHRSIREPGVYVGNPLRKLR